MERRLDPGVLFQVISKVVFESEAQIHGLIGYVAMKLRDLCFVPWGCQLNLFCKALMQITALHFQLGNRFDL